jgi:hypothetical protein
MKNIPHRYLLPLILPAIIGTAGAVTTFTETFDTSANGWLNNAAPNATPTHVTTGGVGNSGYISHTVASVTATSGSFGSPFTQLMFRANDSANASGDAFVGNWISSGVDTMTVFLRHNNATSLDFYIRIAGSGGAGASLATSYTALPNTWTEITFDITDNNPPFSSYGAAPGFSSAFSNIQNMQLGLYLPEGTYTDLTMDIDNVGITAVPEPSSIMLGAAAMGLVSIRRRRA